MRCQVAGTPGVHASPPPNRRTQSGRNGHDMGMRMQQTYARIYAKTKHRQNAHLYTYLHARMNVYIHIRNNAVYKFTIDSLSPRGSNQQQIGNNQK